MKNRKPIRIGAAARAAGVSESTIRYYERRGLLSSACREENGYRTFVVDDVRRVRFIRKAQSLGFTLEETRELIQLSDGALTTCADIQSFALSKRKLVEEKIRQLEAIRDALDELTGKCPGSGNRRSCPILDNLERDDLDNK